MMYLVITLAFLAGFLLVFGANLFLVDRERQRRQYLMVQFEDEFRSQRRERARESLAGKDLSDLASEVDVETPAEESLRQRFARAVQQSGLGLQVGQLLLLCFVTGFVPGLLVAIVLRSLLFTAVAVFIGSAAPLLFVIVKYRRRREKLLSQLPDAFDLMSRVLRAGQTMSQAMLAVADEFSDPIADEFFYCYEQQNLGLTSEVALSDLARRTGMLEIRIFVVAVTVHREAGGNLSHLLDKLASVIRDRYRIRGQIRALTAEGKFQAYILLALPFVILGALLIAAPDYITTLFQYPWVFVAMLVTNSIGALWMRSIINFDF
jgi:tight adherence protein B